MHPRRTGRRLVSHRPAASFLFADGKCGTCRPPAKNLPPAGVSRKDRRFFTRQTAAFLRMDWFSYPRKVRGFLQPACLLRRMRAGVFFVSAPSTFSASGVQIALTFFFFFVIVHQLLGKSPCAPAWTVFRRAVRAFILLPHGSFGAGSKQLLKGGLSLSAAHTADKQKNPPPLSRKNKF